MRFIPLLSLLSLSTPIRAHSNPQDQLVDARQHYQRLCERNKAELVRLNLERRKDFHAAMVTFANVQVQLYNAAAEVWVTASQQLAVSPAAAL
jgi:hypothetical protein